MTNEEAIEVLEVHKAHWERLLDAGICDALEGGNTIQALKVAIRALKNEQTENVGMCQQNVGKMSEKQTDRVSKSVVDQIKWERDIAIEQLKDLGYELGEKPRTDRDLISRQDVIKCFNVRELKFKDKEDAELMKHYLELSFNNLTKLLSVDVLENRTDGDLISRKETIEWLKKVTVTDGITFETGFKQILTDIEQMPSAEKTASEKLDDIIVRAEVQNIYDLLTRHTALLNDIKMMLPSAEKSAEWIPVSERLPEESFNSVIGWDAYRERCVFVQFIDGHFQITGKNESFDIQAWMPLPEPYKEEE